MRKISMAAIVFILVAVAWIFFRQTTSEPQEVNVFSSRKEELTRHLFDGFTRETGIKVNVVVDKAPILIERLKSEGQHSKADLFLTSDIANLQRAKFSGLLQPMMSKKINAQISETLRDPEGYWVALSKRVRAIFYAKERVVKEALSTYENLADPKWEGRILMRSSNHIYNQSLLASMILIHGEVAAKEWVRELVANLAIDIFFPNQDGRGAHVNISGGGVTKHAKNQESAVKLLEYLTGPIAQRAYATINHEFPAMQGVQASSIVQAWQGEKLDEESLALFAPYVSKATEIADKEGLR